MASAVKSKFKKRHLRLKSVKTVHQKVKLFRSTEPFLSVFMWGINHSVSQLQHVKMPDLLLAENFQAYTKVTVDNHQFNKENMPSHFKVKEYCPLVFRILREKFQIDDSDFLNSLTKDEPLPETCSGKSGAKFYVSSDKQFYIKVITAEDVAQLCSILQEYHRYVVESRGETLLPQFLGMYRLTVNNQETYLLVTKNVFSPRLKIHRKYDLKGSTVDRQASEKERAKSSPTFKDNDFVSDGVKLEIGSAAKEKLFSLLTKDVEFLTSLKLMDYSLLVGIHDCEQAALEENETDPEGLNNSLDDEGSEEVLEDCPDSPPESPEHEIGIVHAIVPFSGQFDPKLEQYAIRSFDTTYSNNGAGDNTSSYIYFFAIIDILTTFGIKKRSAQAAKTVKYGADQAANISTVRPEQYAERFLKFINEWIK